MSEVAQYLGPVFQLHNAFGSAGVHGFTPEIWAKRLENCANHPTWILAHITGVRRSIARNLGASIPEGAWEEQVGFGADCLPAENYPAPESLAQEFYRLGEEIASLLASADEGTLSAEFQPTFPDGVSRSVIGGMGILLSHEALHLGQLSFIRRLHGLPGVADIILQQMTAMN